MFAYDFPILGLFWSMLIFFLWFAWIMLVFQVIVDIFRSDLGGLSKGLWSIFVIVVPWLGVLAYMITNGDNMASRQISDIRQSEDAAQAYIRSAAGGVSVADEIAKLSDLHSNGVLTDAEFAKQKERVLG